MVYWKKNDFHKDVVIPSYAVKCNKTYEEFCNDIFSEVKKLRGKIWSDEVIKKEMLVWEKVIKNWYDDLINTKDCNLTTKQLYKYSVREVTNLVADMAV